MTQKGISIEGQSSLPVGKQQGKPVVSSVSASEFLMNPALADEVFGPYSLVVKCKDLAQLHSVVSHLHGQLTCSLFGDEVEITTHQNIINTVIEKTGRLIVNNVPTGVEVCSAMQHGGPFPATTDSRFTAVGSDAIKRFVRPVAFQNFPDSLLPAELKQANPLNIWRLFNNEWTK